MGVNTTHYLGFGYIAPSKVYDKLLEKFGVVEDDYENSEPIWDRFVGWSPKEPVILCHFSMYEQYGVFVRESVLDITDKMSRSHRVTLSPNTEWVFKLNEFVEEYGLQTVIENYFDGPSWFIVKQVA